MHDVNKLWDASLSSNTQGAYQAGIQCLLTFVKRFGGYFKSEELPVLSKQILILFVTHWSLITKAEVDDNQTISFGYKIPLH